MSEVEEKERRKFGVGSLRGGLLTLPALAFFGVASLLLAYLCQSAHIVRTQYKLVAIGGEVKALEAERADLELTVQELTALERVERMAIERLQMVAPEERRVIEVVWSAIIPEEVVPVQDQTLTLHDEVL